MRNAPTLIDLLYKESFRSKVSPGWGNKEKLRNDLKAARRFILDDGMSAFLADLATASFQGHSLKFRKSLIEQMRTSARLPHSIMWVEYNLRKQIHRANDIQGVPHNNQTPDIEGWLLQQHPEVETAFIASLFSHNDILEKDGFDTWVFPFSYIWTSDSSTYPWTDNTMFLDGIHTTSEIICGLPGYKSDKVSIITSPYASPLNYTNKNALVSLVKEWGGVVRRIWALLATINDIPVIAKDVVASKGFVAKGRYRRFFDHRTITLKVPEHKDLRKLARHIVACARKRAHMVRGHWRKDHWHEGNRIWIREHVRGDTTLGFVSHDFEVTHPGENNG